MTRSFKRANRLALLAVSLCCCRRVDTAPAEPVAIAALTFDDQPGSTFSATVSFVSDDFIVLGRHPTQTGDLSGTIMAIQWKGGKLAISKTKSVGKYRGFSGGVFPAAEGHFISSLEQPPELLARDFSAITDIPTKFVVAPIGGGTVAGDSHGFESWNIYRLTPTKALLRQGAGELLSLSDDLLVFRSNDEIKVEKMTGQQLGSFAVPPRSTCYAKALLLGSDRLYINGCGPGRIADFTGKTIIEMPEPDGWGVRFGLTQKGHRLLFDKYTRRISRFQRIGESVESVLTLGMGPVVTSKGELIRVVDTNTGKTCFELDSPERKFGQDGEFHADISPSGNFVVIASTSKVSIYQLPEVCNN